jgi:hypothetical protein
VNAEYVEAFDPNFRRPNVCSRIHTAPWQS